MQLNNTKRYLNKKDQNGLIQKVLNGPKYTNDKEGRQKSNTYMKKKTFTVASKRWVGVLYK